MSIVKRGLISLLVIVFAGLGWFAFSHQHLALSDLEINTSAASGPIVSSRRGTSVSSVLMTTMPSVGSAARSLIHYEELGVEAKLAMADGLSERRRTLEEALAPPLVAWR
jgi:hypothetical protein